MKSANRVHDHGRRDCAPAEPLSRNEIMSAVQMATLAPSVLNIQPWQFVARRHSIEVRRDPGRFLRAVDPYNRAITISCGAALFNLRVAITALGRRPEVELLPEGPRSALLARVTTASADPSGHRSQHRLYDALPARRTSRTPFVAKSLPPDVASRLEEAAAAERATFRLLSANTAIDVGHLVREADRAQRSDDELRSEVRRWVDRGADAVDGIPRLALGPMAREPLSLVRDYAMGDLVTGRPSADFERHPTLGILLTHDDDSEAWLQAGQALERVWLEATAGGLALSLFTQPLEVSILRWLARPLTARSPQHSGRADPGTGAGETFERPFWPQALLRIGVASDDTPATPRRPLSDVLTFA